MTKKTIKYIKSILNEYPGLLGFLVSTVFFNFFLYLKDIKPVFRLSNLDFSAGNLLSFTVFAFSFVSIILVFHIFLLILFSSLSRLSGKQTGKTISLLIIFFNFLTTLYIIADLKIFKLLGVHLHDKIAVKAFNAGGLKNDINLNLKTIVYQLKLPFLTIFIYYIIYYFILKKLFFSSRKTTIYKTVTYSVLLSLSASVYLWLKMNSLSGLVPMWSFIKTDSMINNITSKYENNIKNIKLTNQKNIIIIISESFRKDVFNKENMPQMFDFIKKRQKNIIIPEHNFSGAHFTLYSVFSLIYSVWGYHYRIFINFTKYKDSAAIKLLDKLGYEKLFLTTSHILEYDDSFRNITKQFDIYKEFNIDKNMVNWFKNYYRQNLKNSSKPFIAYLFIYSTHYAYRYPKKFEIYKPVISKKSKSLAKTTFKVRKKYKKELFNRYKNSVLYSDSLFNEIVTSLTKKDRENTIIVFTGDHGEGFWEHSFFGHALRAYKKEVIEVPLMIYLPGLNKNIPVKLSSHVDILPTVIDYISNITKTQINKFFNGLSLLRPFNNRSIIISSLEPIGSSDGKLCLTDNYGKVIFKTTKLTNNAKFIPLDFTDYNDKKIKKKSNIRKLTKDLNEFENTYFKFFYFKNK